MYEVTAEKNVARGAVGRNAKALVYSTLVAASVNNAYFQTVVSNPFAWFTGRQKCSLNRHEHM